LPAVSLTQRLKNKARRFLERPGTTVGLRRFAELLPQIEARGDELTELDDSELTDAGREARDFVEICAVGREAAWLLGLALVFGAAARMGVRRLLR